MNALTRVFLVLLRLAIGWHFLIEGIEKIQSVDLGPTETNRPWTSEPYLREAVGPLGDFFRHQVGDPDESALARLKPAPLPPGSDVANTPAHTRFPPALAADWDAYYDRFIRYYTDPEPLTMDSLTREERAQAEAAETLQTKNDKRKAAIEAADVERLKSQAEAKFKQAKDHAVHWLLAGKKKVSKTFPSGTVEVEETTPTRVEEYEQQLKELRALEHERLPAFEHDVLKEKFRAKKADVARIRNELLRDLAEQTAAMKKALDSVLTPQLRAAGPVPDLVVMRPSGVLAKATPGPVRSWLARAETYRPVDWIDLVTRYGLAAVGFCLLLGLFTRLACLGGAAFLLLFYLSQPPFPWVPANPMAEGHYLFVNKNLIEMIALLTLATTRSGFWAGLDGLVQFLNPRRWRRSRRVRRDERVGRHLNPS